MPKRNGTAPVAEPPPKIPVADYIGQRIRATEAEILKLQGSLAELRHLQSVMKTPEV